MTITTKIAAVAVAAAMAVSASAASAATYVVPLSPTGGSGSYQATYSPGEATFTDLFTFTLPRSGVLSVLFTSVKTTNTNNVNFAMNGARLTGPGYNAFVLTRDITGTLEAISEDLAVTAGTYNLTFKATSQRDGQYTAQFVYAIPEPAIWAMMIMGFGVVGGAMRLRSRKVAFAA